ncbi:MAG TPA: sigma-54 dependent transcriptional regulator [Thermoanaerobaculia bacterium]|nr:sigma-54 dependent transcriptional regulator [Thermoanaerobaculia bacterium]
MSERPHFEAAHERSEFLTVDPRMLQIKELCERVARTDVPVLIMGESGVGKEVLARYIHDQSDRRRKAFVKINCAAVPHDLLESELFGHERGAFTGAHQRKQGKFELANGGTILLDEIGEMSPPLQAKLLHVLEDWVFTRVGGNAPIRIDARIMATTNKPLEEACANGEFREDLYHRLKVIRILVPPLRERKADIPLLSNMFVDQCTGDEDPFVTRIPDQLAAAFLRYDWPGNVRELKHVIQRYLILPDAEMVMSELETPRATAPPTPPVASLVNGKICLKAIAAQAVEEAEKRVIFQVLNETRWNRRRAAERLDICYKTLLNKLSKWELDGVDGARQPQGAAGG